MHTWPLAEYMNCIHRNDWQGVSQLMLSSAGKLASIGADFLICPDNTIHQALPSVEAQPPLPWLHIAAVVAAHAVERGFHRLGLTGMRWLVESNVYPDKLDAHNLEQVRPTPGEREDINRIILEELVYSILKPEAIASFQQIFRSFKDKGCDAVVLGCTEILVLINDASCKRYRPTHVRHDPS